MLTHKPQWATQTVLREKVKRYEGEGRKQWAHGEPASEEAGLKKMKRWKWMKKSIARRSWISERKSWSNNREKSLSSLLCRRLCRLYSKKRGSRSCKILHKDRNDLLSGASKRRSGGRKICRVYRTERSSARRTWANGLEAISISGMSSKTRMKRWKIMANHPEGIPGRSGAGSGNQRAFSVFDQCFHFPQNIGDLFAFNSQRWLGPLLLRALASC